MPALKRLGNKEKKVKKNIFLANIQILVKCFDLVSLYPAGVFWIAYVIF